MACISYFSLTPMDKDKKRASIFPDRLVSIITFIVVGHGNEYANKERRAGPHRKSTIPLPC